MSPKIERPVEGEYYKPSQIYIDEVPDGDIIGILNGQLELAVSAFKPVSEEKSLYRYAEGKWSIREVAGHIIETERIFAYRILALSRGDKNNFPFFDENEYIRLGNYNEIPLSAILEEFITVRESSLMLINNMTAEMSRREGRTNNNPATARAFIYIMAGHFSHHLRILKERYL
jgi:DinB superfamily